MKKIITLILIAVAFALANTPISVKGDIAIFSEDKQLLELRVGTDFSGLLYESVTQSAFLLYAKYGYDDGFFKGHEFGIGMTYGCEVFGVHTGLLALEVGKNSQDKIYYQFDMGFMPVNSINLVFSLRYDDSTAPDNILDYTVRMGGHVGFAFGKTAPENVPESAYAAESDTTRYYASANYSGNYTYVKGHLRRTKSGKVTYVRPHYRRK